MGRIALDARGINQSRKLFFEHAVPRSDIRLGIKGAVRKGLTIGQTVRDDSELPLISVVDDYDSALRTNYAP